MKLYSYYVINHSRNGGVLGCSKPKFIMAESVEDARDKAHAKLDRWSYQTVSRPVLVSKEA